MRGALTLAVGAVLGSGALTGGPVLRSPRVDRVILPAVLRDRMSTVWLANNRHWDELADENTLTQLIGTGKPTQHEYLGCVAGEVVGDTVVVHQLLAATHLRQLQFAVGGTCDHVTHLLGTWHTHPYRADGAGHALKERSLSTLDLATFAATRDVVTLVMWDVDSLDAATKPPDGRVRHPAPLTIR